MKRFYFKVDPNDEDHCKEVDKHLLAEIQKIAARDTLLDEIIKNQKVAPRKKKRR